MRHMQSWALNLEIFVKIQAVYFARLKLILSFNFLEAGLGKAMGSNLGV